MNKEKQSKLFTVKDVNFEGRIPEVKKFVNTYMTAGAMVREIVIKKTYMIPMKDLV